MYWSLNSSIINPTVSSLEMAWFDHNFDNKTAVSLEKVDHSLNSLMINSSLEMVWIDHNYEGGINRSDICIKSQCFKYF